MSCAQGVLRCTQRGAVRGIEVDRPRARNAVNFEVMAALEDELDALESDDSEAVRVVVLRGHGDQAFISGGDLREFASLTTSAQGVAMARRMRAILRRFEEMDRWVIACLNGAAYGGGCEVAVACDVRVASRDAVLGWTQTRFALPCGWGGMTRLVERVGRARALMWLGEGRVLSADEAHAAGLVDEVVEREAVVARVEAMALGLAEQPRAVIGAIKRGALSAREAREASMEVELEAFARCWATPEHMARVSAFLQRGGAHG